MSELDQRKTGVIDIGSNSVRLLLNGKKRTVLTRLSEGLAASGILKEQAMSRTLETVCGFSSEIRRADAAAQAFGTEPLRAAANAHEFIARARKACGLDIRVLTGAEEAELAFIGATGGSGTVVDAGGASVEIVSGKGSPAYIKSLPAGMVRLTEQSGGDADKISAIISESIPAFGSVPANGAVIGVGGSFTSLAAMKLGLKAYDADKVHGTRLDADDLSRLLSALLPLKGDAAKISAAFPVLPPLRAGIITAGAIFALKLLEYLGADDITVSERDNLDGFLIKYAGK